MKRDIFQAIADPSHGIGMREHVETMTLASIMAGVDGIIFEIHDKPEEAYSDGQQTLILWNPLH